jgi:hypothetical protein
MDEHAYLVLFVETETNQQQHGSQTSGNMRDRAGVGEDRLRTTHPVPGPVAAAVAIFRNKACVTCPFAWGLHLLGLPPLPPFCFVFSMLLSISFVRGDQADWPVGEDGLVVTAGGEAREGRVLAVL